MKKSISPEQIIQDNSKNKAVLEREMRRLRLKKIKHLMFGWNQDDGKSIDPDDEKWLNGKTGG